MASWLVTCCSILSLLSVISLTGADNITDNITDNIKGFVVIGPVENITTLYIDDTSFVLTWDPPTVYPVHDVINATMDQQNSSNSETESDVNQHHINGSTNSTGLESQQYNITLNGTSTSNASQPTISTVICRPLSYFSNYTVAMKNNIDDTDNRMVITFKDSIKDNQLVPIIKPKANQKLVEFSKGCITGYVVFWREASDNGSNMNNVSVPPSLSVVNITGLKPATQYKVIITASFVSGDSFNSTLAANLTKTNETKICSCDWNGAIAPIRGCKTEGPNYCDCKQGYEGSFCERCSPGYYSRGPHHACLRCPCDVHSTRNTSCRFIEGFLKCDKCEVGYNGSLCHECDTGFYRFNIHCVPCFCSGNTLPGATQMCKSITGECIDCYYNTTGFHCERCLPGYKKDSKNTRGCILSSEAGHVKPSASMSSAVVTVVVVTVVFVVLLVIVFIVFKRYHSRERLHAFWKVEMKRDRDDIDFNSVHNDDVRLDDTGDDYFFKPGGSSTSSSKYSRLKEDI